MFLFSEKNHTWSVKADAILGGIDCSTSMFIYRRKTRKIQKNLFRYRNQHDRTEADIMSIFKSGKVDALETIRLEMIEMLRITESQEIMDEKPKIKVENEKKVTSNLETLVTPLEVNLKYSEKACNF